MTTHPRRPTRRTNARRGGVYVFVLMVSMLVTILGISAITLARLGLRNTVDARLAARARCNARAAIELGLLMINQDSSWRTTRGVGVWIPERSINSNGTLSLEAVSLTGAAGVDDRLLLRATGKCGEAVHIMEVSVDRGCEIVDASWTQRVN